MAGVKQAELARNVGISPAYLNLIEHNRRRIGGKLLVDLARELSVEVTQLTEGAQAPLIEGLQDAASSQTQGSIAPETDRVEEFAGRFAGWAALVVSQRDRIEGLERRIAALSDRLAHDPFLSDALHEVLSTVTAIRSTAGILNTGGEIDPEWQVRFHRNLYEDSQRLASGSQALVTYLDTVGRSGDEAGGAPFEEFEAWLDTQGRASGPVSEDEDRLAGLSTPAARKMAQAWLSRLTDDALAMPDAMVEDVITAHGINPAALADASGSDLAAAMRRLAVLPDAEGRAPVGIVICDGSGTLSFRKMIEGFAPPRFGAACPLWPLYQALLRPMQPVRRVIVLPGLPARRYLAYAICQPRVPARFDMPEVVEATMLITPYQGADDATIEVGTSCRVCPRLNCAARREPSLIMATPELESDI
ncbi:helix-turn-helix transcriptional regulator [Celeribacter arenosi]|uniref:Helix-turn-helix transcriptional regulator n=1 Tax=Celeribacter arenosi TaxID=792649 RepID=A0ABP7KHR9_9RHOB